MCRGLRVPKVINSNWSGVCRETCSHTHEISVQRQRFFRIPDTQHEMVELIAYSTMILWNRGFALRSSGICIPMGGY